MEFKEECETEDEAQPVIISDSEVFRQKYKWIFLFLLCLSQLGMLYNSQAIPTLQVPFEKELGIDEITYSRILMADAFPNLIFPIIGGYLTDYFGGSASFILTSVVIVLGQSISTFAAYDHSLGIFILGKIVLGIGASTAVVARAKLIKLWYENHEMGRVVSSIVLIDTGAIIIADLAYPILYEHAHTLGFPFLIGVVICLFSLIFAICLILFLHNKFVSIRNTEGHMEEANKQISIKDVRAFPKLFWMAIFTMSWTMISFILVKMYQSKFLQVDFSFSTSQASIFLAASQAITAFTTPFAGILMDKYGKLTLFTIYGNILIQLGTLLNIIIPRCDTCLWPVLPVLCQSVGVGMLFLSFYSSLIRIIDQKQLGLALSILPVLMSLHFIFFPGLAGYIAKITIDDHGYSMVFLLSLFVGVSGLLVAIRMHVLDRNREMKLQPPKVANLVMQAVELQNSPTIVESSSEV